MCRHSSFKRVLQCLSLRWDPRSTRFLSGSLAAPSPCSVPTRPLLRLPRTKDGDEGGEGAPDVPVAVRVVPESFDAPGDARDDSGGGSPPPPPGSATPPNDEGGDGGAADPAATVPGAGEASDEAARGAAVEGGSGVAAGGGNGEGEEEGEIEGEGEGEGGADGQSPRADDASLGRTKVVAVSLGSLDLEGYSLPAVSWPARAFRCLTVLPRSRPRL